MARPEKIPNQMQARYDDIVAVTDAFCDAHLNTEYAELTRKATAALCRKRPSPLARGKVETWACGIIYALGFVNFLFDKSQDPYMPASEICEHFGISTSSGGNYSKKVRDALKMSQLDPNWCLPGLMDQNPLAWMIEVDGFILDARHLPRDVQEIAHAKGLIPYIPGEKKE